jgi:hypothetical protein
MQVGDIESREFRIKPIPHWFFCFSDTNAGKIRRLFFVVLLPNEVVVEPENFRETVVTSVSPKPMSIPPEALLTHSHG